MPQTEKERLMAKRQAAKQAREQAGHVAASATSATVDPDEIEEIPAMSSPASQTRTASSTAVATPVRQNGSTPLPVVQTQRVDRTRELTARDVTIPRLAVAQSMSKVVQDGIVPLGHWYHNSRNRDLGTEVTVIPVDMQKTRSYFVGGAGVMCRSFDLEQGEGNPGVLCEGTIHEQNTLPEAERGCALRLWGEKTQANPSGAPLCGLSYNFTFIILEDPEDSDTRVLRGVTSFRKTQIPAAKKIITMKMEEDLDWTDMVIRIKLGSTSNTRGTFQVPTAEWVGHAATYPYAQERARKLARSMTPGVIRATLEATPE
jgi:hypothetical protein